MKSKGFTLTEIIAVLVILGILVTIATPVYFTITQNTRNNNYNTKIEYLKSKAVVYAQENNIDSGTTINVLSLVYGGYVVPDYYKEEDEGYELPFITNPINDEGNLACRLVDISVQDNDVYADVSDIENCGLENTDTEESLGISLYAIEGGKPKSSISINHNKANWSNKDVLLVVNPTESDVKKVMITANGETKVANDYQNNKKLLTSVTASTNVYDEKDNSIIITTQGTLSTEVTVSVQYTNTIKTRKLTVQIDKEAPIAIIESYGGWQGAENKGASVYLNDGNGSGPAKVYLTNTNNFSASEAYESNASNIAIIDSKNNGVYYLWPVDKAGNVAVQSTVLTITAVDTVGPECLKPWYPDYWVNYSVTLGWGCKNDSESGCKTRPSSKTWEKDGIHTETINFQIEDYVGNKKGCTLPINSIKIDKVAPICSGFTTSPASPNVHGWFNTNTSIIYGCARDDTSRTNQVSGCATLNESKTYTTDGIYRNIVFDWDIADVAKNTKHCNNTYKELKVDKTAPILYGASVSSARSGYNSREVNIIYSGWDNLSGISDICITEGSQYSCNWIPVNKSSVVPTTLPYPDGTGRTYYMNVYIRDFAYNVSSVAHVSYTMYRYCTDTSWVDDSGCDADCGGGHKWHHQVDRYFSWYSCSGQSQTDCNTQECPPPPPPPNDGGGGDGGGDDDGPSSCCCAGYYIVTGNCPSCQACPPPGTCYGSDC